MDAMEIQNAMNIETEVACSNFTPQNWRKTKCQHCFKDVLEHEKDPIINIEQVEYLSDQQNDDCFEKCGTVYAICIEDQIRNDKINEGRKLLTSTSTVVDEQQQQSSYSTERRPEFSKRSCHYQLRSSKGIKQLSKDCSFYLKEGKKIWTSFKIEHM